MSRRKWAVGSFVPCSPRHHHCSPAHAELVRGYREERQRQEQALEDETGNGRGELEFWKDRGGKLIDFKAWLIGHKGAKLTGTFSLAMPVKFERKCGRILTERDLEDTTIATQSRIYAAGSAYG